MATSCDTFVAVCDNGNVVFGKNSDRPRGECQEVVFIPGKKSPRKDETIKCTYIEIPESSSPTLDVILSKPAWMWGAEMGANEAGVVIGNEAVWSKMSDKSHDLESRLLGMDLLRLGLERAKTAKEAVEIIAKLLEDFGQGGQCSNIISDFCYHNSFLAADSNEAWVVETAGKFWVAQKISSGVRNISNCLSIEEDFNMISDGLLDFAKTKGWWDGESKFNWKAVMGSTETSNLGMAQFRLESGEKLLKERFNSFNAKSMMEILRDEKSLICRNYADKDNICPTAAAQVSVLSKDATPIHYFTATPNPTTSVFKRVPEKWAALAETETCGNPHQLWTKHFDADLENESLQSDLKKLEDENLQFREAVNKEIALYEKYAK